MVTEVSRLLGPAGLAAVVEGHYSVLLGAGFSAGAKSKDSRDLPLGDGYGAELTSMFGMDIRPNTPLQHIWDAACHRPGMSESVVRSRSLEPRFVGCRPASYHGLLSTFVWKRIFTFNVDDVVQNAYDGVASRLQDAIPEHFEDAYTDPTPSQDRVQLVCLHGSAGMPGKRVVFSPPAYAEAIHNQNTWFHVFASSFRFDPFIVIGATLREPDFESYLAQKAAYRNPLAPPSLFVDKAIDDAARAICARLGLIPVEATGEKFLEALAVAASGREKLSARLARRLSPLALLGAVGSSPHVAAVGEQFCVLPRDRDKWPSAERPPEVFYEGYDASWQDIRAERDTPLKVEADIATRIRAFLDGDGQPSAEVAVLSDGAGTGKTTAAMRIAGSLASEGRAVMYLAAADRLKDEALSAVLAAERTPVLLVIDRMAEHAEPVARFLGRLPKNGPRCYVLGAERRAKEHLIRDRLKDLTPLFFEMSKLVRPEAADLARKLRSAAKLGPYAGKSDDELAEKFVAVKGEAWAGQLVVVLLEVTKEKRHVERLADEWSGLALDAKRFYGAICIASACGYPVRSARAFAVVEASSASEFTRSTLNGSLRGLIRWEMLDGEWYLKPRHRVIAEEIVRHCMSEAEVYDVSLRLAGALSPYVNRKTVMGGSPDARLMREIMDEDGTVIPRFRRRADEWFGLLRELCEWNSRYWEQRALAAMRSGSRKRARDYASTGVGVERHWQPLTTYARVLIDSAQNDRDLSRREREEMLRQGLGYLDEAIRAAAARNRFDVHPYHLLLDVAVRVARSVLGGTPDWLVDLVRSHASTAEQQFGRREEIRNAISALRAAKIL